MIRILVLSIVLGCILTSRSQAEKFTLMLRTKTGNINNAGTDDPVFFALYYQELVEIPNRNPKRKPRKVLKQRRLEVKLDNEGNDRKVGAIEDYKLEFECPIDKINRVEIGLKSGDDAWFLDGMQYIIVRAGTQSLPTKIPFSGWVSAAANDGPKAARAKQFYWFNVKPPRFPPKLSVKK